MILINCQQRLGVYVSNEQDFTALADAVPNPLTISPATVTFNTGGALRAGVLIATYDMSFVLPVMKPFENIENGRRLYGISAYLNEKF